MRNILVLGGGHGLHAVIQSLKNEKQYNIKALISTADSGGHTGKIIEEFAVPAVGDIRRNLASTLDSFPLLQKMLEYRFDNIHGLKNVSLGNLMILSLLEQYDLETLLKQFKIEYKSNLLLLPLYNKPIDLHATYTDGTYGKKEHLIPSPNKKIKDVFYEEKIALSNEVVKAIKEANFIIIGPGSLYTSVGAVLADETVKNMVLNSNAKIIYVCNIMTEPNETDDYTVLDHITFIETKIGKKLDYIIANKKNLTKKQYNKYKEEGAFFVKTSKLKRVIYSDLLDSSQEYVRHDFIKLRNLLVKIIDK